MKGRQGAQHLPLAVEAELRARHELVAEGRHAVDLGGHTGRIGGGVAEGLFREAALRRG